MALAANVSGKRSLGGVLTRSRALRTAVATAVAVRSVSSAPLSSCANRPTRATGARPFPLERYAVKEYAPSSVPSAAAARSMRPSVLTAWPVPASARAAAPDALRTWSALGAPSWSGAPSPTATSSGAAVEPRVGTLATSSGLPLAPATASRAVSSASPPNAAATSSEPGARRGADVAPGGGQEPDHDGVCVCGGR